MMHVQRRDVRVVSQWEALGAFLENEVISSFLFPPQGSRLYSDTSEEGTAGAYIWRHKTAFPNTVICLVRGLAVHAAELWNRPMTDFVYY